MTLLIVDLQPKGMLFKWEGTLDSYQQLLMLLTALFLVMIVELLNTCIELVVDRIGPELNELSGRAKDIGSAAVALSMLIFVLVWGLISAANLGYI